MKTLLLLLITFLNVHAAQQDCWTVTHNNKLLLQVNKEEESANVVPINKSALKSTGHLTVNYTENNRQKDWVRTIALVDENGNELLKQSGTLLKVSNAKLASLANIYKIIKIYSWALPADPQLAATVRVRRVHLCTLTLKD